MINFISALHIPQGSGLSSLIFSALRWIYNSVGNYGFAIIIFTISLRIILLPMDFGNKYFTKKNAAKMAEFKDEDAALKKLYGNEPMKYLTARRQMYRKNGFNPGTTTLFMLVNVAITLFIFITVFQCLTTISSTNLNRKYQALGTEFVQYTHDNNMDTETFRAQLNTTYTAHNAPFLWVHNIFRPDTWTQRTPSRAEFNSATRNLDLGLDENATAEEIAAFRNAMYETIIENLNRENREGWNGYFILIVAAGVTMYFSTQINMSAMQKKKKAEETSPKEVEVGYSMRKARDQGTPSDVPQINPEAMMKMMKFMMPAIMVFITFTSTAAFALYITAGAIVQTTAGLGSSVIVDRILKNQEEKTKKPDVINPHSRYFKKQYE